MLAAILGLGAAQPGAIARITDLGGGSSGRSDLWRVGWQVFTSHPLAGVGIGNFEVVESHYTLRPGAISRIGYLVDVPHLVHNTYLQLLAETGVIGLALYLLVLVFCVRSTWSAIQRFESIGWRREADLARAVLMGVVGMSVALFFISDGDDVRLWVLLAMGPALATFATRAAREKEHAPPLRRAPQPVPARSAPARRRAGVIAEDERSAPAPEPSDLSPSPRADPRALGAWSRRIADHAPAASAYLAARTHGRVGRPRRRL